MSCDRKRKRELELANAFGVREAGDLENSQGADMEEESNSRTLVRSMSGARFTDHQLIV